MALASGYSTAWFRVGSWRGGRPRPSLHKLLESSCVLALADLLPTLFAGPEDLPGKGLWKTFTVFAATRSLKRAINQWRSTCLRRRSEFGPARNQHRSAFASVRNVASRLPWGLRRKALSISRRGR